MYLSNQNSLGSKSIVRPARSAVRSMRSRSSGPTCRTVLRISICVGGSPSSLARRSAISIGSLADVTEAPYETSSDVAAMLSKFMEMSRILSLLIRRLANSRVTSDARSWRRHSVIAVHCCGSAGHFGGSAVADDRKSPARRGFSGEAFEHGREVCLSLEAHVKRDLAERRVRAGQHRLCTLDSLVEQIVVRTVSRRRAKLRSEVHSRQAGHLRQVGEADALVKVRVDILLHTL